MPMKSSVVAAPSRGRYINTGNGQVLHPVDIGHDSYVGLVDPDTAFWSLIKKDKLAESIADSELLSRYRRKSAAFAREMKVLRFGLKPSAVYLNPTERCNLDCDYCYIPRKMRKGGRQMSPAELLNALAILKGYFKKTMPKGSLPQVVFHGSEPMLSREAVFAAIERHRDDFRFGLQTNATLLDDSAIDFLTSHNVGIGISLDGHTAGVADRTRRSWSGEGSFSKVIAAMERLKGYPGYNVICTVTNQNMRSLVKLVDFFHACEVPVCMLNPVRCTQQGARDIKPTDAQLAKYYLAALPENRTQDGSGQLCQCPRQHRGAHRQKTHVRYLALRRRTMLFRPLGKGRHVSLQRVHRPARFQGREHLQRRYRDNPGQRSLRQGDRAQGGRYRAVPPLRNPSFLRLALPGGGSRNERRHGQNRRLLRTLRGAGALRPPPHCRWKRVGFSLGRVGFGDNHHFRYLRTVISYIVL